MVLGLHGNSFIVTIKLLNWLKYLHIQSVPLIDKVNKPNTYKEIN
jgi:hypothetical protein